MSHKVLITFFSVIIVSSHFTLFAETQNEIPQKLQNFIEKIESKKDTLQGGAIAILHKGQVIYKTTFGNQKGRTGRPITSHTLFPLASVSKTVSAAAIALMVDRSALDLDKIFKLSYLKNPVSLRNILSHTTGYKFSGNTQIEQGLSRQKLLKKLENQKPQCKPGACYSYSNTIFSLVEEALNRKNLSLLSVIQ
jgi:beta-lactamase class C